MLQICKRLVSSQVVCSLVTNLKEGCDSIGKGAEEIHLDVIRGAEVRL